MTELDLIGGAKRKSRKTGSKKRSRKASRKASRRSRSRKTGSRRRSSMSYSKISTKTLQKLLEKRLADQASGKRRGGYNILKGTVPGAPGVVVATRDYLGVPTGVIEEVGAYSASPAYRVRGQDISTGISLTRGLENRVNLFDEDAYGLQEYSARTEANLARSDFTKAVGAAAAAPAAAVGAAAGAPAAAAGAAAAGVRAALQNTGAAGGSTEPVEAASVAGGSTDAPVEGGADEKLEL